MYPTLQDVCEQALALPCSPALLPRLNAVLANPDATVEEMEAVLRIDPVLASSTIRLANSAYFAGSMAPVETVNEAVMRLGLREVHRLASMAVAGRWMTQQVTGYGWEPGDFFRVSLVTALAAETLANETGRVDPGQAYTAGLIGEIGKLAIAHACGSAFEEFGRHQRESNCPWSESERAVLGYNYATVGAELLRRWKFPESFSVIAENNPPGPDVPEAHRPLAAHVHAAKYLACAMGPGQGIDGFLFALNNDLLTEQGLTAEMLERSMVPVFERTEKILRDKVTTGAIKL